MTRCLLRFYFQYSPPKLLDKLCMLFPAINRHDKNCAVLFGAWRYTFRVLIPEFYLMRDNKSVIDRNHKHAFHLKSSFLKTT